MISLVQGSISTGYIAKNRLFFFFKQKTAYEVGLGIPAGPLFRSDCYQYFCVPEYGTANGRLHFHAVHFMRTLPTGSVDPNFGRRVRNRRQLNSLQNTWPYGYSVANCDRSEERRVGKESS